MPTASASLHGRKFTCPVCQKLVGAFPGRDGVPALRKHQSATRGPSGCAGVYGPPLETPSDARIADAAPIVAAMRAVPFERRLDAVAIAVDVFIRTNGTCGETTTCYRMCERCGGAPATDRRIPQMDDWRYCAPCWDIFDAEVAAAYGFANPRTT